MDQEVQVDQEDQVDHHHHQEEDQVDQEVQENIVFKSWCLFDHKSKVKTIKSNLT